MAQLLLCSVYDTKVAAFGPVFVARSKGEALRVFGEACKDTQSLMGKYPGDYQLHFIGGFNDMDGRVTGLDMPDRVLSGDELG